jgi:hypothetical protein
MRSSAVVKPKTLAERAKRMGGFFDERDIFVFGGIAVAAFGLYLVYPPLAFICAGAALFWLGVK